jgi:hypothetical protein
MVSGCLVCHYQHTKPTINNAITTFGTTQTSKTSCTCSRHLMDAQSQILQAPCTTMQADYWQLYHLDFHYIQAHLLRATTFARCMQLVQRACALHTTCRTKDHHSKLLAPQQAPCTTASAFHSRAQWSRKSCQFYSCTITLRTVLHLLLQVGEACYSCSALPSAMLPTTACHQGGSHTPVL